MKEADVSREEHAKLRQTLGEDCLGEVSANSMACNAEPVEKEREDGG